MAFQNADEWDKAAQEFEAVLKLAGNYKDTAERYVQVVAKQKEAQVQQTSEAQQNADKNRVATLTAVPPTAVPIQNSPTPKPTYAPSPTYTPQATPNDVLPDVSPTHPPPPRSSKVTVIVKSTYQGTCRIILWGPANITIDAGKDFPNTRTIAPGTYGWRAFVNDGETGQAKDLIAHAGDTCSFTCDGSANTIWWGCK